MFRIDIVNIPTAPSLVRKLDLFHQVIHGAASDAELRSGLGQVASVRIADRANIKSSGASEFAEMHYRSVCSEIDEDQADDNGDGAHDPKRRVRYVGQFAQVGFELIGECEVGDAFEDQDHTYDTEKIFHWLSGPPSFFIFCLIPELVHFGKG